MVKIEVGLEEIINILYEDGYFALAHGTGRNGDGKDIVKSIFEKGLRTKDNSLYYTTIGLDKLNVDDLKTKLDNWPHLNSERIILMRIPLEYINIYGDSADLDGEKYGAFMVTRQEGNKNVNYLNSKFILGSYDRETKLVTLNPTFEKELSEETKEELTHNYKKVLEKFKEKIERQSEALKIISKGTSFDTLPDDLVFDYEPSKEDINDFINRN